MVESENVMDQLMIEAYKRHLVDVAMDEMIENSYDYFDVSEPAGRDAGYAIDIKDENGIVEILLRMHERLNNINLDDAAKYFEKIQKQTFIKI